MSTNTDEGFWDDAFGSIDEAVGRSFDNQEGGGLWDGTTGWLDHMAGSTDEAVGRQFDNQAGGGFANWFADGVASVGDWAAGDMDEAVGRTTSWPVLIAVGLLAFWLVSQADIDLSNLGGSG